MQAAIVWLRHDLRLADNPALLAALQDGHAPLPVYIHDPAPGLGPGAAGAWWLHHSLQALQRELRARGSDLLLLQGDSRAVLAALVRRSGAAAVYWNRRHDPAGSKLDRDIEAQLHAAGIAVATFPGGFLREPGRLLKANGEPYRVFTPFWKALQQQQPAAPAPAPLALPPAPPAGRGADLDDLQLVARIPWHAAFQRHWEPGESGAWEAIDRFCDTALQAYGVDRDRPDLPGTSRLSPHLHFGEITPRQVWQRVRDWADTVTVPGAMAAAEGFLRQIAWRDFAGHLLLHFPHTLKEPLDARYARFPWRRGYRKDLQAWQRGSTGIPIVDAGMRELWATGWMHNRVRMIAASLLTKNLLIPWQEGARWFQDTLLDADAANNTLGWQWTAGCGADAAPYFRIFNPVRQGERFDPDGSYTRQWVPELQQLAAKWIHRPWEAPPAVLAAAGITPGRDYPAPIIDLQASRIRALDAWEGIKRMA